jgi:hypothetical protein
MTTCKVCSKKVRKTSIALILRDGTLKGARVCQGCLSALGVTIVVAREVPRCKCGQPATKCHACAGSKSGDVQGAIKALEGRLKAAKATPAPESPVYAEPDKRGRDAVRANAHYGQGHHDGRIEGLESIIELLKSGRV